MNVIRKTLVPIILFSCFAPYTTAWVVNDDFAVVKQRVVAELMKGEIDPERVEDILSRMQDDGSFSDINYDDLSRRAGFPHRHHTYDLVYLARAYQKSSSPHHLDKQLKQRIVTSLQHWVEHDYFGDNWHNNQISTPTNLVNLMLIIGDELPDELVDLAQPIIGRAHMNASGARPSGDRIVIAGILAKNLLFTGDEKQFDEIIRLIEGEVKFSTGKRGMQHDYSFHHRHDRVNNTTSYGYGKYANAFGEWAYYVSGTKYAFSENKINHLVDYYLEGICKQLVYGIYTDISVKNRSISHKATFEPRGTLEIERLLHCTDHRKEELEHILQLRMGAVQPSQSFAKFFWQTEHFVFQRPNFYTTVRMYSTRNMNMEVPYNGPGKTTHHRADGTNYLQLTGREYHNIWPVYDWQRISGTTVLQKPRYHPIEIIRVEGLTDFVGAVTDGLYGAVAYDFRSTHDLVRAKKSWFFFDDEYVCLGAGIHSNKDLPLYTTIDQVLMKDDVYINQNNEISKLSRGSHVLRDINWVHHNKVAYLLPEQGDIGVSNQEEQGRWSDITDQKNISDELISEDVFAMWFDHGEDPDSAGYAYIVVPGINRHELSQSGNDRGIEILSNTVDLQAVTNHKLNMSQLAFYRAGEIEVDQGTSVKIESQGMAMIEMENGQITKLTVADPSRRLNKMVLSISGLYEKVEEGPYELVSSDGSNTTTFIIQMPQGVYLGKSVVIELELNN